MADVGRDIRREQNKCFLTRLLTATTPDMNAALFEWAANAWRDMETDRVSPTLTMFRPDCEVAIAQTEIEASTHTDVRKARAAILLGLLASPTFVQRFCPPAGRADTPFLTSPRAMYEYVANADAPLPMCTSQFLVRDTDLDMYLAFALTLWMEHCPWEYGPGHDEIRPDAPTVESSARLLADRLTAS